jgi:hypothetical protein
VAALEPDYASRSEASLLMFNRYGAANHIFWR